MPFAYYNRLTQRARRIYRQSEEITSLRLPAAGTLSPLVADLERALATENCPAVQTCAQLLTLEMTRSLKVPGVSVRILTVRPAKHWGELHGLYNPPSPSQPTRITLWMRTAQRKQVVRFRTFFRTLIHELCHHLDYELLHLEDSFHTEGFYRRESSLVRQLLPQNPGGIGSGHAG
ncbi:MAG: hypothetical protein HY712_07375 [candidate division NC10 bacterium]|nr:hypothetical protein [candidate division NC10 bacterium]